MPALPKPFGNYLLLDAISRGGMAEIWRARRRDDPNGAVLAIKRLLPAVAADPEQLAMFLDEARIMVQLAHPSIAHVFDVGQVDGEHYIAMELVAGRDLRAIFTRAQALGETVPVALIAYIVRKMCEGLDHAHRLRSDEGQPLGVIHRDVSHENCLVTYDGRVKLIDFGVAKIAQRTTRVGVLKGKLAFMSPEQVQGLPLDRRSDVFAAGVMLYELLAGSRLFWGNSEFEVLRRVLEQPICFPQAARESVPPDLEAIVLRALERDPERRFAWASDLAAALAGFAATLDAPPTRDQLSRYMRHLFGEEIGRERAEERSLSPADETLLAHVDTTGSKREELAHKLPGGPPAPHPWQAKSSSQGQATPGLARAATAVAYPVRRRWPRWAVSVRVQGRWWDTSNTEHPLTALLLSVSQGGAMLRCADPLMANGLVELQVPIGRLHRIVVRGNVRWWSRVGEVRQIGLEFAETKPEIARHLDHLARAG